MRLDLEIERDEVATRIASRFERARVLREHRGIELVVQRGLELFDLHDMSVANPSRRAASEWLDAGGACGLKDRAPAWPPSRS